MAQLKTPTESELTALKEQLAQREAELAVINSVQQGLASRLDMQAIYDLVGDKIRDLFNAQVVLIAAHDRAAGMTHARYLIEKGKRFYPQSGPLGDMAKYLMRTHQPLLINENWEQRMAELGFAPNIIPGTEIPKSTLYVPLIVGGEVTGSISLQNIDRENAFSESDMRLLATLANSMSVALENARLFDEVQKRNAEISEALERETATNEILGVIASSPTDVQPVLDSVAENAARLSGSYEAAIFLVEGEMMRLAASNEPPAQAPMGATFPINRDSIAGRAILDKKIWHIPDLSAEDEKEFPLSKSVQTQHRAFLAVPLLREGQCLGVIFIRRIEPRPFTEKQIELVKTFADQAVIAIENVRLFNETNRLLKETEQRAAELAIINSVQEGLAKQLDFQGIIDLVGEKVGEIFAADTVLVGIYDPERDWGLESYYVDRGQRFYFPQGPIPRPSLSTVIIEGRKPLLTRTKMEGEAIGSIPVPREEGEEDKNESVLGVPILAGEKVRGVILVQSYQQQAFNENHLRLLQTLANSMSVALENARLFDEVQKRNREITEALEQQTATSEILSVIASSPTDIQPVLDVIAENAAKLSGSEDALIGIEEKGMLRVAAHYGDIPMLPAGEGIPFNQYSVAGRAIIEGRALQGIHNPTDGKSEYPEGDKMAAQYGYRLTCAVPLMREGKAIGAISIRRMEPKSLDEKHIEMVQGFANQAVIAIENVRLFNELQTRNREITEALEQQTATSEILQVIASSPTDVQPVMKVIVENATHLCGASFGLLYRLYGEVFSLEAYAGLPEENAEIFRKNPPRLDRASLSGRVALERRTIQIEDVLADTEYIYGAQSGAQAAIGYRTALGVPIMRESEVLGYLAIGRRDVDPFNKREIDLVTTFANQAAIAMENVRLFNETTRLLKETEQRAAELAIINSVQEGLASKLDIQAIYDLVGDKIRDTFHAQGTAIFLFDHETEITNTPYCFLKERFLAEPAPFSPIAKLVIRTTQPKKFNTNEEYRALGGRILENSEEYKSGMYVPLVIGKTVKGMIGIASLEKESAYSDSDLRLLQTLANSMSVALENARLFDETQRLFKAEQQRAAELAIINSVQEGLAKQLDFQGIIDLVGGKVGEIFDADTVFVGIYDPDREWGLENYYVDRGQRFYFQPGPIPRPSLSTVIIDGRKPLLARTKMEWEAIGGIPRPREEGEEDKNESVLGVPILAGEKVRGVILVQSYQQQAFNENHLRLLQTLASSMSVALENARLFDETQRLLKETEQRAQELATVNTVSNALAGELDLSALIELVGEQIRSTFKADIAYVALLDQETDIINFPYQFGQDLEPLQLGQGLSSKIVETGEPLLINKDVVERHAELGATRVGKDARSYLGVPIFVSGKAIGVVSVQSTEREDVFTEDDQRLLSTIAANVGVALQNARLFNEVMRRKEYFEALFQNNPVAVVTVDNNITVTSWNPAAKKLFGYTQEEAIGQNVDSLVAKREDLHAEAAGYSQSLLKPESGAFQAIVKRTRKDNTLVDVELSAVPIIVQGKKQGIYALYHDITELQRARQEAIAANEAKSAFLATMSHEIRTPMNAVIGMSGLLMDTQLTKEQHDYAETIRSSGDALLAIINDILDFSKIEAGRMDLEHQPFDLRECIETALDLIAARAVEKGLDIAYLFEGEVPPAIRGDVTRLRQILLNLLSNAVKFTDSGEVVLTLQSKPLSKNDVELTFSVRDTGIGISRKHMDRLFESFSQADSSTTRKYGGTGLGLAISRRLAEMMGGRLWAESKGRGKGSTFTFTIVAPTAALPRKKRGEISGIQPELQGKRVLIVDDNATNRRILSTQTNNWGMSARATASPGEALQWLRQAEHFDVAILDMHMPDMDGVTLAKKIHKIKAGRTLPLVLFTSLGRREAGEDVSLFAAYLAKPIKPSQLFDTLANVFAGAKKAHTARPAAERPKLDPDMAARRPLHILLAEDNAVNQKLALRLLEQMGYRADVASNGIEAVESVQRQPYDVVLMDVQMPDMDGLEATRQILARWPRGKRPRIVGLTANAMQGDREVCIAAGMDDYITKPIRVNELVGALERAKKEGPPQRTPRAQSKKRKAAKKEAKRAVSIGKPKSQKKMAKKK